MMEEAIVELIMGMFIIMLNTITLCTTDSPGITVSAILLMLVGVVLAVRSSLVMIDIYIERKIKKYLDK